MKAFTHWIVLTDLDGTLLDHDSYSSKPAHDALSRLALSNIPCIFNTSKTFAEVAQLRRDMHITSPFVCENGSALFIAKNNGQFNPLSTQQQDYNSEVLATPYADLIKILYLARQQGFNFRSFNDMPANEVAAITGLSEDKAWLAKQRSASEPLLWRGHKEELPAFRQFIESHKLQLIQGGRFYHVMGASDKANANHFFRNYYAEQHEVTPEKIGIIALGDGENDRNMLEQANYPIVIPAAENTTLQLNNPNTIIAKHAGPVGWNQEILKLIEQLGAKSG
jgi:mannosyl-3-phosphoglycerate phosphatase